MPDNSKNLQDIGPSVQSELLRHPDDPVKSLNGHIYARVIIHIQLVVISQLLPIIKAAVPM